MQVHHISGDNRLFPLTSQCYVIGNALFKLVLHTCLHIFTSKPLNTPMKINNLRTNRDVLLKHYSVGQNNNVEF